MTKKISQGSVKRAPVAGKRRRRPLSEDIFVACRRVSLDDIADILESRDTPSDEWSSLEEQTRKVLATLTPREEKILRERALASIGRAREAKKRKSRRN